MSTQAPRPDARAKPTGPQPIGHAGSVPGGAYQVDGEIHLLDRVAIIYRYRAIAISVFVLTTLAVVLQGYAAVPMFRATARILIEDERSTAIPGLGADNQFYEDPEPYYNTQYKIIQGRDLARKVIARLNLHSVAEFNGTAQPRSTPLTSVRAAADRLRGLVADAAPPVPEEAPAPDETPDESALVGAFVSRVVVEPVRASKLVDISFDSLDADFAARAVNALAEEYVSQNLALKLQSTEGMLAWLDKEIGNQQQKVLEAEQRLQDYRTRQNALSFDDKNNIVNTRLNKLNDDVLMVKTKKARAEVVYNQIRALTPAQLAEAPPIAQNVQVATAKGRVLEAQRDRAARLARGYLEKHPEVVKADSALQEASRQYDLEVARAAQSIKNDYETAVLEEATLTSSLNAAKADAQDLSRKSVDYGLLEREADSNRKVYEALLQRQNELRVSSNSRANNVRIVDQAEVPKAPTGQGGARSWPIGITLGLVLAVLVPFMLDYINDTVKTPEDVTRQLKLPFLGLVPAVRGDKHPLLASSHVPHDFGESFRSLRTALISKFEPGGTKILLFTSAQPLEGKTTTAVNIAMALAYGGARVLVVDADMRRPGLHRPLRLTNERGLSQVLTGQARVRDVIQRTVDPNLLAITAGRTPPNPSELLTSERMKTLLTNLAHGPFDWIVIDTPPVLAVTDAVVLAPLVSGVTFVIGAEMTRRRLAERALETILSTRPKHVSVVLNKVDFARNKYYYSRYYGHQYKNYYAQAM
jgi:capsular exopolysaccharide synthesis family protein